MLRWCWGFVALTLVLGCGSSSPSENDPAMKVAADNIYVAARQGDLEAVRSFIERGAWSPQRPDGTGLTPLTCAVEGENVEIIRLMVENGADVNQIDARLRTPLQVAEKSGNSEVIEVLKQLGATK